MNKKQLILFIAVFLLFIFGFVMLFINSNKEEEKENNKNESEVTEKEKKEAKKIEHATDNHHHPEDEEILTKDDKKEVDEIRFEEPVLMEGAFVENSGAVLLGATEEFLLLKTFDNILYTYNLKTKKIKNLGDGVKEALITSGNEYIFYVKEMNATDVLYQYDIALSLDRGPKFAVYDGFSVTNLTYANGVLYYTYPIADAFLFNQGKGYSISEVYVMPKHRSRYGTLKPEEAKISYTTPAFTKANNAFYYFSSKSKSIQKIDLENKKIDEKVETVKETIEFPALLAVNHKEQWVLVNRQTLGFNSTFYSSDGLVKDFTRTIATQWFYNKYLLVADNEKLFFYNPENKEKQLLKANVYTFVTSGTTIYYQDISQEENRIYMLKTKRQD